MNKEILRNGSGVNDYTAYKAIMNTQRGGNKMEIQKGDIYEAKRTDGKFMNVIVLAVHEDVCNVLALSDEMHEGSTKVICQGEKYTSVHRIQYLFNNQLRRFIRKLTDKEFSEIMDKVAEGLGIGNKINENTQTDIVAWDKGKEAECYKAENEELKKTIDALKGELSDVKDANSTEIEYQMKRAEENEKKALYADFYKEMYEKLLEKVIA